MIGPDDADARIKAAMDMIWRYSGIDGDHHRAWLVDQVVRALTGEDYRRWVLAWENEDGTDSDEWYIGIPP